MQRYRVDLGKRSALVAVGKCTVDGSQTRCEHIPACTLLKTPSQAHSEGGRDLIRLRIALCVFDWARVGERTSEWR